jgi:hypothetical protein
VQVTLFVPAQAPLWQVSLAVHALWSSHDVPSGLGGFEQSPVTVSQTPAVWHWSDAVHVMGAPPQTPPVQTSFCVHGSPSLHAVPFGSVVVEQRPVLMSHVPALWQTSATQCTSPQTFIQNLIGSVWLVVTPTYWLGSMPDKPLSSAATFTSAKPETCPAADTVMR